MFPGRQGSASARPFLYILTSAALFGISVPVAKLLVADIAPVALAGLLYAGAFIGLATFRAVSRAKGKERLGGPIVRSDIPYLAGAVASGGIAAPILMLTGLTMVSGFASSLFLNLEGIATAVIALVVFREQVGKRTWAALAAMTAGGALLTLGPMGGASPQGAALIVLSMACWGLDNNLTSRISGKDPSQIAMLKGLVAGSVSLASAALLGQLSGLGAEVLAALLLGALSYGVSLVLFIFALDKLGSSRTGAFYSFGPFVGAAVSIPLLGEAVSIGMLPAAALMALGTYLLVTEKHSHRHRHERVVHAHRHSEDEHHHHHETPEAGTHLHEHVHEAFEHNHSHYPDSHHRHRH
jgi:drug/metabolite transporter (DMT)-like permease